MEQKNKFIIENVTLDNELVLEKLNLTSNFNLFYARNGVSKTTIFNFLKNNYLNKFDNEYKIIGYSYLEQLKNLNLLYENLKKINLLNDTKDVIDSDKKIKKIIDDLKSDLNFLLKYKNFLIGYSENKFYFETKYNERKSSLEEFINDLDTFVNKILKNKNLLNDFLSTFFSYDFNLNSLNKNTLKEVAVEFNDFEKK